RKDLRAAVESAQAAAAKWGGTTGYLRGQIVYRIAEMLEGRRASFEAIVPAEEVDAAIDLTVSLAGWSDKASQVLGGSNPVAGPYHNFTIPGPMGVQAAVCPDAPALLGLVGTVLPALVVGCPVVALVSRRCPQAVVFAEVLATSDVPGGAASLLTGDLAELAPHLASHRSIASIVAVGCEPDDRVVLERGAAENLKRVHCLDAPSDAADWPSLELIEHALEYKTIWHPSAV
ncbi:MAG: aldehyde dehydrogenase family protein, partial [Planctomycetota bacterium]